MIKTRLTKVIFILCAVVLLSIGLCACGDSGSVSMNYANAKAYTVADRGEIAANLFVSEIEIDWINGEINIISDENADTVSFYETAEGEEATSDNTLHYLLEGSTLHLKYCKSGKTKLGKLRKELYVTVPASARLWKIDVENVSGTVNIECPSHIVEAETVSGAVNISGNVQIIEAESVSGNVDISCGELLADLDVETVSGNVRLYVPEDKGFKMDYDTVSGHLYNVFDSQVVMQGKYYFYLDGSCKIDIDTVSGSLSLLKLER